MAGTTSMSVDIDLNLLTSKLPKSINDQIIIQKVKLKSHDQEYRSYRVVFTQHPNGRRYFRTHYNPLLDNILSTGKCVLTVLLLRWATAELQQIIPLNKFGSSDRHMSNNEELYRKGIYATKRVKRIHDKLTKQFDHLILDPVFEEMFQRILSCNNPSCGCHNTGSNVRSLAKLIQNNQHLFHKTNLYEEVDPLNAEQSTDKLAITPVDERPGQVHRGVTAEKVQEFFRRVHDDTARELNNPVNYQGWDGTNCVTQHGNYTLTGIYCFLVENKIDMRDEFKDTWELLRLRHHWVLLVRRRVTNAYARDHKKRFDEQNYEPIGKAVFLRERLSHILDDWKVAIENPDTGPLFKCDICGLKFSKKYAVRCCKNMNRANFPTTPKNAYQTEFVHYYDRKCVQDVLARNNYDVIISRVGVGLKCFSSECSNPILPKEIHPFQTPQERSIILNLLIRTLVNRLEHSPPIASDLEYEDSDDDTQLSTQPSNESSVTASENNDEE